MINTSLEFKNVVNGQNRKFYSGATITLADNTVLTLDNNKIRRLEIEDATSQNGSFTIGSAIINELTLSFNNMDDAYSDYDFTGAIIRPTVGLQLSESIETLNKGVFTADDPRVKSSVITLSALDNMVKFDKPFKDVKLVFPTTAQLLLTEVCIQCGVTLSTTTFTNSDFVIVSRPLDDAVNCREIVSWIAQLGGNFARINTSGALEIKWYDFEVFEDEAHIDGGSFDTSSPYATGDTKNGGTFSFTDGDSVDGGDFTTQNRYHHFYSMKSNPTISTDDVVITGITVYDNSESANSHTFGESGYLILIEKNPLIQSLADSTLIAQTVGAKIVGMKFRPMSFSCKSDPSVESGDVAYMSDRKGTYQTLVTNLSYGVAQPMKITCDAESPARNSSTRYSETTKAIVETRKNTETKLTAYDLVVKQMTDVIAHGYGMFKTEIVDESGGIIFYLHDKPIMSESTIRWFTTSEGTIEQTNSSGTWVTVSGTDKQGNALYNVLTARKVSADIIRTGKIFSDDGSTLIDMAFGVANSDNLGFIDNIQSGFPLSMPFNIDDTVSKINKVLLKFTQQAFRTYSDGASSGGSTSVTSETDGDSTATSSTNSSSRDTSTTIADITMANTSLTTESALGPGAHTHSVGSHNHSLMYGGHWHTVSFSHDHSVDIPPHSHNVPIPSHVHNLNFGIMETPITNYAIDIYVDNVLRTSITNDIANIQGIIDLTEFITTVGWHTIEIRSTALKRVSAQINIKSYIRS